MSHERGKGQILVGGLELSIYKSDRLSIEETRTGDET